MAIYWFHACSGPEGAAKQRADLGEGDPGRQAPSSSMLLLAVLRRGGCAGGACGSGACSLRVVLAGHGAVHRARAQRSPPCWCGPRGQLLCALSPVPGPVTTVLLLAPLALVGLVPAQHACLLNPEHCQAAGQAAGEPVQAALASATESTADAGAQS